MTKVSKSIMKLLWTIFLIYFMQPGSVFALNTPSESVPPIDPPDGADYFLTFMYVCGVLILIIGLIIVLIKFLAQKNKGLMSNRSVKNLIGVQLGQNKSLQVVEIGHSLYIVGVGEDVQLIEKIDQAEEINYIKESLQQDNRIFSSDKFVSVGEWFKKLRRKENVGNDMERTASFQEVFNDKMMQVSDRKKRVEEMLSEQYEEERPGHR